MTNSPVLKVQIEPGTYSCLWDLNGDELARGELILRADRPPSGNAIWAIDEGETIVFDDGHEEVQQNFPQTAHRESLFGRLDTGQEVLLLDVHLHTWFEDRTSIAAAVALVGHAVPRGNPPKFAAAELQITALDAIAGVPPIRVSIPGGDASARQWLVQQRENSAQKWTSDDAEVRVYYNNRVTLFDSYKFSATFSPAVGIHLEDEITLREWIDDWCVPLRRVVGAATGRREEITYLSLEADDGWSVAVFGSGISQSPYQSNSASVQDANPAFKTSSDGISLLTLLQGWRSERDKKNPLVEVYDPAMLSRQQHPRSRVLLLIQLLEALYGFENSMALAEGLSKHVEKRRNAIEALTQLRDSGSIDPADFRFIKERLPKEPPRSLDVALRAHFDSLPESSIIQELEGLSIIQEISATVTPATPENALRVVRNKLSHGERSFSSPDLDDLSNVLDRIVRSIFLRVLGCHDEVCGRALKGEG